jgi:hypothetical protein
MGWPMSIGRKTLIPVSGGTPFSRGGFFRRPLPQLFHDGVSLIVSPLDRQLTAVLSGVVERVEGAEHLPS